MIDYEEVADCYDDHFRRPVDEWEDQRLSRLLAPYVDRAAVLDLGCGTGWLLDHLKPISYTGVDRAPAMLDRLAEKHPWATTIEATVGTPRWTDTLDLYARRATVVTATWSAHELGPLPDLFRQLHRVLDPGTIVALHGQGPRYRWRRHYVLDGADQRRAYREWTPRACRWAWTACPLIAMAGTGCWPDFWPWRRAWEATLGLPASWHYAFLAVWRLT